MKKENFKVSEYYRHRSNLTDFKCVGHTPLGNYPILSAGTNAFSVTQDFVSWSHYIKPREIWAVSTCNGIQFFRDSYDNAVNEAKGVYPNRQDISVIHFQEVKS